MSYTSDQNWITALRKTSYNQVGERIQHGDRVFRVDNARVDVWGREILNVTYEDNGEQVEVVVKGIKIGEDWIQ